MFDRLGSIVSRTWPLLLLGWAILFGALWMTAPPWEQVAKSGQLSFLPPDMPTRRGERLLDAAFPGQISGSTLVLVLHRKGSEGGPRDRDRPFLRKILDLVLQWTGGDEERRNEVRAFLREILQAVLHLKRGGGLPDQDRTFLRKTLEPRLRQIVAEEGGIVDPGAAGRSGSGAGTGTEAGRRPIVLRIRSPLDRYTGPLLVSRDGRAALVIVELTTELLEGRHGPLVRKVRDEVERLRGQGRVPEGLEIAVTGSAAIGHDYGEARRESARAIDAWAVWVVIVFLLLVYRAPLAALIPLVALYMAVRTGLHALALLGKAGYVGVFEGLETFTTVLVYGAGVDYSLFLISRYREELAGDIPIREAVARAVGRTGTAIAASAATEIVGIAMLTQAGFQKFQQAGVGIALGLTVMLVATLTLLPALLCLAGRWAFWPRRQEHAAGQRPGLLHGLWVRLGQAVQRRPGTIWLATVVLLTPLAVLGVACRDRLSYSILAELPRGTPSVAALDVLTEHFPAGFAAPVTVLLRDDAVDFTSAEGIARIEKLSDRLEARRDEVGLADVRSAVHPLGITTAARQALPGAATPSGLIQWLVRRRGVKQYVGLDGHATRLELVLKSGTLGPDGRERLEEVERAVRSALPEELGRDADLYFLGPAAGLRDLRAVAEQDRRRIQLLVTGSVLLILMLMLWRWAVPIYLILTVLFGYLVALGATFVVFALFGTGELPTLDWTVPLFLFTLLIAVGEDYNIYLVARVVEEQKRHGPVRGVVEGLVRTGGIISSCGLIMAGTFATLALGGSLAGLYQLGIALALGVLLDTFVVRPILVPPYLILVHGDRLGFLSKYLRS